MPYPFGKAISYKFYALKDDYADANGFEDLSSVTDNPSIYVWHSEDKPSRTEAAAGTGADETITSWGDVSTGNANGKSFTIAAIQDPDATATKDRYNYWIAINFVLVDSGTSQTVIRALPMMRIQGHHEPVSTTKGDLEDIFPSIDAFVSDTNQDNAIQEAITNTKIELTSSGVDWAKLWRPSDLNQVIAYRALSNLMIALLSEPGDQWSIRAEEYRDIYKAMLNNIRLDYDSENDGEPTSTTTNLSMARIIR